MKLKKITFSEKRKMVVMGLEKNLNSFYSKYGNFSSIWDFINSNFEIGHFYSTNQEKCIEANYGRTDDKENDMEWWLAKILFSYSILSKFKINIHDNIIPFENSQAEYDQKKLNLLLKNSKNKLIKFFNEYEINWNSNNYFIEFKSTSTKSIIENLNDIENKTAEPIKELLGNMKSDTELRGHINEVYADIEKIEIKEYKDKLNTYDYGILKDSYALAKRISNDASDAAKGHNGNSSLTTRDIAHNFALLSSLVWKIINIANEKSN